MSLYDFVYNLQRKPDRIKKRILIVMLVVSFILLSAFWVFMFKRQVSQTTTYSNSETETVGGDKQNIIAPAAAIIEGLKGLKSDISEKISAFKSTSNKEERPVYELPVL
jgi:cytoskeletal protein RodZ